MLPSRLPTNLRWDEEEGRVKLDESEKSYLAYEFPKGTRVPVPIKREEKRIKFSFQGVRERDNEDEAGEEDDNASVVSTSSAGSSSSSALAAAGGAGLGISHESEQAIKVKLQACMYELGQLAEVLQAKELGSIHVERAPQSLFEREQSLAIALAKRTHAFQRVGDMFSTRISSIEREIQQGKREYFKDLVLLSKRYKIVAPTHSEVILSSLKPDEPLAIEYSKSSLIHLRRGDAGGLVLFNEDEDVPLDEFKPHALKVELFVNRESKGTAMTPGFHQHATSNETKMEALIRDAHARELFKFLGGADKSRIQLDDKTHLVFKLGPESKSEELLSLNKYDGICSLALNLLQRRKSIECIQHCCAHLLHMATLDACFGKYAWQHSEDEADSPEQVESRCLVDFASSGRYAAEFIARRNTMCLDWHTFDELFLEEGGTLKEMIGRAEAKAVCLELQSLCNATPKFKAERVTDTSFHVCLLAAGGGGGGAQYDVVAKVAVMAANSAAPTQLQQVQVTLEEVGGMIDAGARRDITSAAYYELRKLMRRSA